MFKKIKNTLVFRVALSIFIASFILASLSAAYFYHATYQSELQRQNIQIHQLAHTVQNSAAIAAYLSDQELALQVLRGLTQNDIVNLASIRGENDFSVTSNSFSERKTTTPYSLDLPSPFLHDETVGILEIYPRQNFIDHNAQMTAIYYSLGLFVYAGVIIFLVSVLISKQLTTPLERIKKSVDSVLPGKDKALAYQPKYPGDEIGQLVKHSNYLLTSIHDTLEREKQLRETIERVEKRFRLLFEQASVCIVLMTSEGKVVLSNQAYKNTVQKNTRLRTSQTDLLLFPDLFESPHRMHSSLKNVLDTQRLVNDDFRLKTHLKKEQWYHCLLSLAKEETGHHLIEAIMYDISERASREKKFQFEADFDSLTTLYNRRSAERYLRKCLENTQDKNHSTAIVLIDLDHFKPVNDTYGHEAGDKVLIETAKRLMGAILSQDLVCRWGGDEFLVIVQYPIGAVSSLNALVRNILTRLVQPIEINQQLTVSIGASLGVSCTEIHGRDMAHLINLADEAMYQVKRNGRNGFCLLGSEATFI
ncbi:MULTISPECIES: sensor domain-containing diguanylate cyclase [unclassified Vibrio]|uniref:Diguanylate cyclase n=1 Tax=Vibrio sp. HB236076 TaxID=3232307 RepID=A0AB39H8Q4_9VIBR|nr:sensor domain-containing diguanylate cyclase [Vibrio sp. HB161653]MDP5253849.1 sensor domain-containing diguanylate cyclase [Vibrio sp. HB161653]